MKLRPSRPVGEALVSLAERVGAVAAPGRPIPDLRVTGVTLRSQDVVAGDLFAALPGASAHGARYAADAVQRGAVAVLTDPAGVELDGRRRRRAGAGAPDPARGARGRSPPPSTGIPRSTCASSASPARRARPPPPTWSRPGCARRERVAGLIGTVGIRIDGRDEPSALTTPEAPDLQALLAVMVERGVDTVVMEVSSHALTLGRVDAVHFAVGGFTNLSRDHLDFHPTMQDYLDAKARLFDPRIRHARRHFGDLCRRRRGPDHRGAGRCTRDGECRPGATRTGASRPCAPSRTAARSSWRSTPSGVHHGLRIALPGRYNVANGLLALALLDAVGVSPEQAAPGTANGHRAGPAAADRRRPGLPRPGRLRAQARCAARGARDATRADPRSAGRGVRRRRQPRPGQA